MRWLLALVLAGCGSGSALCSDAPLGGDCVHIEGRWLLQGGQRSARCGAEVFGSALIIDSKVAGSLEGAVGGTKLLGGLYPAGVFELYSVDAPQSFSLKGTHHATPGQPEELRGGVSFSGEGELGCEREWQFIATRQ